MEKTIDYLFEVFQGFHATAKANPSLVAAVRVKLESDVLPLGQIALLTHSGPHIKVQPFDKSWLNVAASAIECANLGVSVEKSRDVIFVKLPQLTGEWREKLMELAKNAAEKQRIAIRNIRRDARKAFPSSEKQIDSLTKEYITLIDDALKQKLIKLKGNTFNFNS